MQGALTLRVWLTACGVVSILAGCNRPKANSARESGAVTEDSTVGAGTGTAAKGKVPISTKSEEGRTLYSRGLELADQVRAHDARQLFEQAAAKDPTFAMAHYQLALNSPTSKEFWVHLNQAVALSDKASEGERLTILALQAGANGDPAKSKDYSEDLVAKYPQDERAHLALAFTYTGEQDYQKAIDELKKAVAIAPDFSPAYNALGYAYRPLGNNAEAEKAFKKYIELVPNDPNPYDSYAELLMKTGRFDESIAQYRKALSIDPHFTNSYYGIASDLMFQNKHDQALAEAQKLNGAARNDADRRLAMFTKTVVYVDQGKTSLALQEMQKQYALGAKINDTSAMAGDAVSIGDILLNSGNPDEAHKRYDQALSLLVKSSLSEEVKEDAKLAHHYDLGRCALAKNDIGTAKSEATAYLNGAKDKQNDFRIRQAHELVGMIAIKEKKFDDAIAELDQANRQDPYIVYAVALAYQGKGDQAKAKASFQQAAEMYTLPGLRYG